MYKSHEVNLKNIQIEMFHSIEAFCTYKIKEKDNILMKILFKKKKRFFNYGFYQIILKYKKHATD